MSTTTTVERPSAVKQGVPSPETYLTLDRLLKSHATDPSDPILLGFPAKGISDYEEFTAKDLDRFTDVAVANFVNHGLAPAVR
jgi:hypothetical protein